MSSLSGATTSTAPRDGRPLWADADLATVDLDVLDEDVTADLCVVGLGGTGLAAVAAGVAAGRSVVGIDAGTVAGLAAGRNGGLLLAGMAAFHHDAVARHGRVRALAWYHATLRERDRLVAEAGDLARPTGSLRMAASPGEDDDLDAMHAAMVADDLPVAWAEAHDGRALVFPGDAVCNPLQRCRRMARDLVTAGAVMFRDTPATAVAPGLVTTSHGSVSARRIIVAVDGALHAVLPGLRDRVRPVRLQMAGTTPSVAAIPRPVYRRWGYEYWQQLPDGRVALGGGRDRGGAAEDTDVPTPTAAVQSWLDELADEVAPDAEVTHRWAAIVGFTPDGVPICEQVADGVWAVGGHSGTGNVIGPLLARELVEWSLSGAPSPQMSRLYPGLA